MHALTTLGLLAGGVFGAPDGTPPLRTEYFALEIVPDGDVARESPDRRAVRHVGLVAWRRRIVADGIELECASTFQDGARGAALQRVLHVERLTQAGPRLVWRETASRSGRALRAEWTSDGASLHTVEWSPTETCRESFTTRAGAVLPLYLAELARTGSVTSGAFLRFDPLVRDLERVELCTSYAIDDVARPAHGERERDDGSPRGSARRTVELWRDDGSLAGRFVFTESELIAFQWQASDVWARRISEADYLQRAPPDEGDAFERDL